MARVTVEDCIEKVDNRFELVALAAQRAKSIASGATITIERDNDKDSVIALREIAQATVAVEDLRNQVTQNFQRPVDVGEEEIEIGDDIESVEVAEEKVEAAPSTAPFEEGEDTNEVENEIEAIMEEESESDIAEPPADEEEFSFEEDNIDVDD